MTKLFSNNAETTLQVSALLADVTMTVKAGDSGLFNVLAAGQTELVTLTDGVAYEVVEITAWAGDVATVTRGVEGTAQAWGIGTLFSGRITAGAMAAFAQTADLPTPAPAHSIGLSLAHRLLVTDAVFDMTLLTPDAVPDIVSSPRTGGISTTITLPVTTNGNAYTIHFTKPDGVIYQNFHVPVGETLNTAINGTDFAHISKETTAVGVDGYWELNFA